MNILLLFFVLHTVHGEFGTSYLKDRRLMDLDKEKKYYVVELMDPPPNMDVEQFVCVPNSWLVLRETEDIAAVKFPIENVSVTKQRVKRREEYSDSWMIFVANVKYGTDTYKDAKSYIKILKKILSQNQNSDVREPETSEAHEIRDEEPAATTESDCPPLPDSDDEQLTKVSETINTANNRYFTRQSRKLSATENLSQAISVMSLHTSLKGASTESYDCMDKSINSKHVEDIEFVGDDKQDPTKGPSNTLMKEQLPDNVQIMHNLSTIAGSALQDQNVLKRLEKISVSIKQSIVDNATKDPSKIKTPVFGEDFIGLMQDLYSQFDQCQMILHNVRNQYIENCLTTKKIIELVNTLNNLDVNSHITTTEEFAKVVDTADAASNMTVEEGINKDIDMVIDDTNSSDVERPQTTNVQREEEISTVSVQKTNDATDKNASKNDRKADNEIRDKALKFTLPPEYDPEDSKWTLRYRKWQKGLVELLPHSGVYVNAIKIANCKRLSRESKTLARLAMIEVYSDNALKTCSLTGKRANAFYCGDNGLVRPGLDQHARMVLMNFVDQHAKENKWALTSTQAVVDSMRNKLQELRIKSSQRKNK